MNEWLEKIQEYLEGKMSPEEQQRFKAEMAADQQKAGAFNMYRTIETDMHHQQKDSAHEAMLNTSLKKLNEQYFVSEPPEAAAPGSDKNGGLPVTPAPGSGKIKPSPHKGRLLPLYPLKRFAVAASIIATIAVGILLYLQQPKKSMRITHLPAGKSKADSALAVIKPQTTAAPENTPEAGTAEQYSNRNERSGRTGHQIGKAEGEALFAMNFTPDAVPDNIPAPLQDAFDYYEAQDYEQARLGFESVAVDTGARAGEAEKKLMVFYTHYYPSLSLLASNHAAKAIPGLKLSIAESTNSVWKSRAQWYLSLAYLKAGEPTNAAHLLAQVSRNKQSAFATKASLLLGKLKK